MATSAQDLLAANEKLSKESFAPLAGEINRPRRFPRQNIKKLGESGLLGFVVFREYGDVLKQKLLPAIARRASDHARLQYGSRSARAPAKPRLRRRRSRNAPRLSHQKNFM